MEKTSIYIKRDIIISEFPQASVHCIALFTVAMLYQQQQCHPLAFALSTVRYSSVRHQLPEKQKVLMVGSDLPSAILSNPAIATQPSIQGSIFARPYANMKRSPQYDVNLIGLITPTAKTTMTSANRESTEQDAHKMRRPRSTSNDEYAVDTVVNSVRKIADFQANINSNRTNDGRSNSNAMRDAVNVVVSAVKPQLFTFNTLKSTRNDSFNVITVTNAKRVANSLHNHASHRESGRNSKNVATVSASENHHNLEKATPLSANVHEESPPIHPAPLPTPWPWSPPNTAFGSSQHGLKKPILIPAPVQTNFDAYR